DQWLLAFGRDASLAAAVRASGGSGAEQGPVALEGSSLWWARPLRFTSTRDLSAWALDPATLRSRRESPGITSDAAGAHRFVSR
ncbi:MAG: hypothetical protein ACOC0J_02435, partial [Myxococcota bacterium]